MKIQTTFVVEVIHVYMCDNHIEIHGADSKAINTWWLSDKSLNFIILTKLETWKSTMNTVLPHDQF